MNSSKILLHFLILFFFSCNAQHSVTTNEIIRTDENLFGVKSKEGKQLIDPIYKSIRVVRDFEKLKLPPSEGIHRQKQLEYYSVTNTDKQQAIFDKNGKLIFGFMDCLNMVIDPHTQTVVITKKTPANPKPRSHLYHINGKLVFDTSYENIGFISYSDLIVLVAEDSPNEEFYLYNPFTKNKLGPYDHFNIFNEDSRLMGIKDSELEKYKKLNVITVRKEIENEYHWGMIDAKGKEILPLEYKKITILLQRHKNHPAFKNAKKPEGVDLIFTGSHISKPSTAIYFDSNFKKYEF